jgi:hypothetical protein
VGDVGAKRSDEEECERQDQTSHGRTPVAEQHLAGHRILQQHSGPQDKNCEALELSRNKAETMHKEEDYIGSWYIKSAS